MKTTAGLWIDHRKAVIATVTAEGEETMELRPSAERRAGRCAGIRPTLPGEARRPQADDAQERALTSGLDRFHDRVAAAISDAEAILIFGPGAAKGQLRKRIEQARRGGRIFEVEMADEMTDRQIAAKVREFLLRQLPARR